MKKTVSILALTGILLTASVQAMDPQQWREGGNDQAAPAHMFPHVGAPSVPPRVGPPSAPPCQFQSSFWPVERKPAVQQTREFFPSESRLYTSENGLYKYCPIRAGFVKLTIQDRRWASKSVRFALAPYFEDYKNELEQGQKEAIAQAVKKESESWENSIQEHVDRILEETYQKDFPCVSDLKKIVKKQEQKIKQLERQRKQDADRICELQDGEAMPEKAVAEHEKRIRAEHEKALKAMQTKLEQWKQALLELRNRREIVRSEMEREVCEKNQRLEKELAATVRGREHFKKQFYKLKEEHEKSNSLKPDLEKAQKSNAGLIASRDQLIAEKGQLELDLREKDQELKRIQSKQRKAEKVSGEYAGKNAALSAANNDLRQRVKELEQALSAPVKKQSSDQRAEFIQLQGAYEELNAKHERLVRGHKEAEEAFKQKMRKMNQKLSKAGKQSKDAEKLRAENEKLSAQYEKLMGEYQQLKSGRESKDAEMLVQKLRAEKEALSADYIELMADYRGIAKDFEEVSALLNGTIELKEAKIQELEKQVADLQARLPRS